MNKATMNSIALALLVAGAFVAPMPALADEPVIVLERTHLAAAEAHSSDAWARWAEDFSREMRTSMGAMFAPRMGSQKLVKGAPYSADVVTENNQALPDGNAIQRKTQGAVYRDGEGRTRQETPGDGKQPTVFIHDPVEGRSVILTPGSKRAIVSQAPATPEPDRVKNKEKQVVVVNGREVRVEDGHVFIDGKEVSGGKVDVTAGGKRVRVDGGRITVDGKEIGSPGSGTSGGPEGDPRAKLDKIVVKTIDASDSPDGTERQEVRVQVVRSGDGLHWTPHPAPPIPPMPPAPPGTFDTPIPPLPPMPGVQTFRFESRGKLGKGVTTAMGTKDFDGVKAEGKSTVWTIAAGEIGNRNAINVTSETWYSPELQLTVYSRYNDPRTGESIYRLANIRRGEPSAELFRIPAGYETKKRVARER
jgi:hypothetical protein